jgi:hypothetical protein
MMKAKHLFLSLSLCASFLTSCCTSISKKHAVESNPPVEHVVLVWLNKKGDAATRAKIIETAHSFRDIPGIIALSAGEPLPSPRPVVDSSFDVGIVIRFVNKEALAAYETNPKHVKAVTELLKPASKKIVVHDITVK